MAEGTGPIDPAADQLIPGGPPPAAPARFRLPYALRWVRRPVRRWPVWPLLMFVAAGWGVMWAMWPAELVRHPEIATNVAGIEEGARALKEGQFPIRVLPFQSGGTRYPLFQFYGNFLFTAGGLIGVVAKVNPYVAFKIEFLAALACGGGFTYRLARRLTRRRSASLLAGLVFLYAPYLFTDVNARGAVAETIALCLVPAALFYTHQCFSSRRRGYMLLTAVAWTAIALTHNITYLYGVAFGGIYTLLRLLHTRLVSRGRMGAAFGMVYTFLRLWPRRNEFRRLGRLAAAGALHGLLILWYFVPQFAVVKDLNISQGMGSPFGMAWLTPADVVFAPYQVTPVGSTTERLGLQVGWPILILAAGAALAVVLPHTGRVRWPAARVLVPFGLALLLAWSPVDVWAYLPKQFYYVQFPFRLLGFVMIWGALAAACGLAAWFPRGMSAATVALFLAWLAASISTYYYRQPLATAADLKGIAKEPFMGGGRYDYLVSTVLTSRTGWTFPDLDLANWEFGIVEGQKIAHGPPEDGVLQMSPPSTVPIPPGGEAVRVEGTVIADRLPADEARPGTRKPVHLTTVFGDSVREEDLPPGPFAFRLPLPQNARGKPGIMLEFRSGISHFDRAVTFRSIRWEGAGPAQTNFLPADQVRKKLRYRRVTKAELDLPAQTVVQLPVIYYPHLLRVTDNGRRVDYGNVGRFVALDLPPGKHHVEIKFAGIGWANAGSAVGVGWLVAGAILPRRRWWRRER